MKYKLIAIDMDRTLLNSQEVSDRNRKALVEALENSYRNNYWKDFKFSSVL